jgi:hypothetical protein
VNVWRCTSTLQCTFTAWFSVKKNTGIVLPIPEPSTFTHLRNLVANMRNTKILGTGQADEKYIFFSFSLISWDLRWEVEKILK